MTRMMLGLCVAAAFGVAITAGAQTTPTTTRSQSTSRNEITVTGCLERGVDGNFILTNASEEAASSSASGTTGTTGTTGTAPGGATSATPSSTSASAKSTWKLEGGTDLSEHVGHKVQVTGRAAEENESHAASSATGTTGATGASSAKEMRELNVKSVKMISSACP